MTRDDCGFFVFSNLFFIYILSATVFAIVDPTLTSTPSCLTRLTKLYVNSVASLCFPFPFDCGSLVPGFTISSALSSTRCHYPHSSEARVRLYQINKLDTWEIIRMSLYIVCSVSTHTSRHVVCRNCPYVHQYPSGLRTVCKIMEQLPYTAILAVYKEVYL